MGIFRYVRFIMGLVYIAAGLFFFFNPFSGNDVLSYALAAAILAYGAMRTYMGYKEIYGNQTPPTSNEE